jgi:hypothetical protein
MKISHDFVKYWRKDTSVEIHHDGSKDKYVEESLDSFFRRLVGSGLGFG